MLKCLPIKENISVYEGDDCTLDFKSSITDLTGYTVKLQARIDTSSRYPVIDVDGVVSNAPEGEYQVVLPSVDTLGKSQENAYYYDVKLTSSTGDIHTDRSGMLTIEPRTTDLHPSTTTTVYGVDIDNDGNLVKAKAHQVNFLGSGVKVTSNAQGGVNIEVDRTPTAPTLALHFAGIYDTLQDLQDAIAKPSENMQAIVIGPSEHYYHGVAGQWVQLAPVGAFHSKYLGVYDTVDDLKLAEPTPEDESLAIIGTSAKTFYVYESGDWVQVNHTDLPDIDARLAAQENKMVAVQKDVGDESDFININAVSNFIRTDLTDQYAGSDGINIDDVNGFIGISDGTITLAKLAAEVMALVDTKDTAVTTALTGDATTYTDLGLVENELESLASETATHSKTIDYAVTWGAPDGNGISTATIDTSTDFGTKSVQVRILKDLGDGYFEHISTGDAVEVSSNATSVRLRTDSGALLAATLSIEVTGTSVV